jgi:1-phosphatidylinositol-4-phosphate 5-kinase
MPEYKRHPNTILFWRAIADLGFGVHTLRNLIFFSDAFDERLEQCMDLGSNPSAQDCRYCIYFAAITQFTLIAADAWFACLAYDLHSSLTNPFSSFKLSMKLYHVFVWSLASLTTFVLVATRSYGFGSVAICWIRRSSSVLAAAWAVYYIWIFLFGFLGVFVYVESRALLSRGLASTYKTRSEVILANQRSVATVILYWFVVAAIYTIFIFPEGDNGDALRRYSFTQQFFGYVFACRGLVSAAMWFQNNSWAAFLAHLLRHGIFVDKASKYKLSPEERYRPQVNVALRNEMLFYITRGIQKAVDLNSKDPLPVDEYKRTFEFTFDDLSSGGGERISTASRESSELKLEDQHTPATGATASTAFGTRPSRDNVSQEIRRNMFLSNVYTFGMMCRYRNEVTFTDYFPSLFATIRYAFNISEPNYVRSILNTLQAKMSEGASGAFMFPSADGCFLIKSTTQTELNVLLSILGAYTTYMLKNPKSLLTRFFGCHCVRMYGQNFYFIVVANIFHTNRVINSRYDIKGSWISRNADPVVRGKAVTCRHCGHRYIYGESTPAVVVDSDPDSGKSLLDRLNKAKLSETTDDLCPERVGGHEPDVVLKDNDLTYKMRLHPQLAHDLVAIIKSDAEFLRDLGIMDYSLIIGVSNEEFEISSDGIAQPVEPLSVASESPAISFSTRGIKSDEAHSSANLSPSTAPSSSPMNEGGNAFALGPRRVTRSSVDTPVLITKGRKSNLKGGRGALGGVGINTADDYISENIDVE